MQSDVDLVSYAHLNHSWLNRFSFVVFFFSDVLTCQQPAVIKKRKKDKECKHIEPISEVSGDKVKKKKARTTFTGRQIFELEKQFEIKKYLSSSERADMAKLLNVTETQVSHLFICFFFIKLIQTPFRCCPVLVIGVQRALSRGTGHTVKIF